MILGIESSCDEFAVAILHNNKILAGVVASQIEQHRSFGGVAPEVASRLHTELALPTVKECLAKAAIKPNQITAVAYTNRPGLVGSLLVGASFAKAFAWALNIPSIAVDHIRAHLYINHLVHNIDYPYLGAIISGGHTTLMVVKSFNDIEVIGSTIDDACGECYDKVAKHYGWGFPGGPAIDKLSKDGDELAFNFPFANLYKGNHRYDMSYSGLKNAVINQLELFKVKEGYTQADIAAGFQRAAIGQLMAKIKKSLKDFNLHTVVIGGGVAANSYLRAKLAQLKGITAYSPPLSLCGDNGEMIAFLGGKLLEEGEISGLNEKVYNRVLEFKRGLKSENGKMKIERSYNGHNNSQ
ncbi:MAG: tRNA (adenosine(37)-N6)-threonylcarbamoyltransferase complex transferase subunit TsaD [Spirochaetaceae bacterium]|nr:tRNA (adenosine(37)-N6)-threonylcarbamoyltransferase complex transferase subunit TsaD [Spirochaetaceae bacterium]